MTDSPLPDFLVTYFNQRQQARADRINAFLAQLTPRERALVEQAAVMGYVRGTMAPKGEKIPLNKEILTEVVDACFVYLDCYPVFHVDLAPHPATSTWTFEGEYAPDKWHGIGSSYPANVFDNAYDMALDEFKERAAIDKTHLRIRMIRADTVFTVAAEHDPQADED